MELHHNLILPITTKTCLVEINFVSQQFAYICNAWANRKLIDFGTCLSVNVILLWQKKKKNHFSFLLQISTFIATWILQFENMEHGTLEICNLKN